MLYRPPRLLRGIYPNLTWRRPIREKVIFLTFDDGPVPELTPFVLEELEKYNASATFFCVGDNIRKNGNIARDILKKGHQLANHTFNHLNGWKTNSQIYQRNIEQCEQVIAHLGLSNKLFRPPYGKVTRNQIRLLKHKYEIVMWDVLSRDYDQRISGEKCLAKTVQYTRPGSIIVFHDNPKAHKNLTYTLPRYLDHFSNAGFQFKVL